MYADELAKLELKFKEQLKTNENLKLQLAAEEDRYKVSSADWSFTHSLAVSFQAAQPQNNYCIFFSADYGRFSSGMEPLMVSLIESSHSDSVIYEQIHPSDDILLLFMSDFGNKLNSA